LDKVDDPSFATVSGLILWQQEKNVLQEGKGFIGFKSFDTLSRPAGDTVNKMSNWLKKFLP
jgi:hypothetical protein